MYISVVCPVVTGPDNGTVALSTNGSVTVAVFTCDSGHSLTGSPQLTCKTDELWDNTEPVCGKKHYIWARVQENIQNDMCSQTQQILTTWHGCQGWYESLLSPCSFGSLSNHRAPNQTLWMHTFNTRSYRLICVHVFIGCTSYCKFC